MESPLIWWLKVNFNGAPNINSCGVSALVPDGGGGVCVHVAEQ